MKLRKGLLTAWIILQVFLLFLNIRVLIFISVNMEGLREINELGRWLFFWIVFSVIWVIGSLRIFKWYKLGKFHIEIIDKNIAGNNQMKKLPTLHLDRLLLRPFRLEDAKVVQQLAGDRYIAEMTLNIPHPYEDGVAEKWIETHNKNFNEDRLLELAIVHKEDNYFIGAISIGINKNYNHGELAYWVGKKYMNNGYCTEAAKGIVKYAFEEMKLNRIFSRHLGKNPASGKVMKKIGMQYEGLLRQHVTKWGQHEDLLYYGLLREEYFHTMRN